MTDMFDGTYTDPFELSTDSSGYLINFASGAVAPPQIQESMTNALSKGATMAKSFIAEHFIVCEGENIPKKSLYDPIPRSNIKTMANMHQKVKVKYKDVTLDGEVMYFAINASKKVPLKRVLSFENSPVPLSLFTDDGNMRACAKSDFMHKLEDMVTGEKTTSIQASNAVI